jgi:hypothetical protein
MFQQESLLGLEFLKRLLLKNHASFESLKIGRVGKELPRLPQPQRELSKLGKGHKCWDNKHKPKRPMRTHRKIFKLSDKVLR